MSKFWDKESEPMIVEKNGTGAEYRIRRVEKDDKKYREIREWFMDKKTGNMLPTKKGVVIPEEVADDVVSLLDSVKDDELK